jgi:hypothetical protein
VHHYRTLTITSKHCLTQRGPKQGSQMSRSTQQHTGTQRGGGGGQQGLKPGPTNISNMYLVIYVFGRRIVKTTDDCASL